MQEQAAPPRFSGYYPHKLSIPANYLPRDKFVQEAICTAIMRGQEHISSANIPLVGKLKGSITTNFPKLILRVYDREILRLAGPELERFDDIDCKDITCTCGVKPRYEKLFCETEAHEDAIVYNTCKRTIFAAAKRQMKSAPTPTLEVAEDFFVFARMKIQEYCGTCLQNFGYSYEQWYNHLTYQKQKLMDQVYEYIHGVPPAHRSPSDALPDQEFKDEYYSGLANVDPRRFHYEALCKVEVQDTDGKPRMVCKIPDLVKFIMGPVTWKLEEIFQDHFPVYCGGMNLTQMQDKINHYIDEGFCIVAEGDGSAFDNTQDILLKKVDRYIYDLVAPMVHHVPQELFRYVTNQYYKVMDVINVDNGSPSVLMTYAVLGTVFSGDTDTTLMNTIRMGLYNWYTNEKAGLKIKVHFQAFSKGDDFTVMYHIGLGKFNIQEAYRAYWLAKAKPDGPSYNGRDERCYGLGQILKFIEHGDPNMIKFCSLRAWYTDNLTQHIYLTRDPKKFMTLSKYSRKTKCLTDYQVALYLEAQAEALEANYSQIDYFMAMAQCYRIRASQFMSAASGKRHGCRSRDRRSTLPLGPSEVYDGFNYEPRHDAVSIIGDYWGTMQVIERKQEATLTPQEAYLVNQQIAEEFPTSDLQLLVAQGPL